MSGPYLGMLELLHRARAGCRSDWLGGLLHDVGSRYRTRTVRGSVFTDMWKRRGDRRRRPAEVKFSNADTEQFWL
jgi:hypothetical protein